MDFVFDILEGGEVVELEHALGCRVGEQDIVIYQLSLVVTFDTFSICMKYKIRAS